MCAIVDANVGAEIIKNKPVPASQEFAKRMFQYRVRLAIGGELRPELARVGGFMEWAELLRQAGLLFFVNDGEVDEQTERLRATVDLKSNDAHVLALAQLSGARLLYSMDGNLQKDFKNKDILSPRGKIYSNKRHTHLLAKKDLCQSC